MCAMHAFKPFSMSGRCGPVSEVFSQRDLMVGLVSSSGVLQYLEFHELIHKATVINTRLNEWSRSHILWGPICIKHWHLKPLKARFYTLVNPRQRCPVWTQHGTKVGSWCSAYIRAEKMLRNTFPIFAMRTKLHKGAGIRLNLFEPRYKWLAHRVTAAKDSQQLRFMYCTSVPQPGAIGWLTEMQQLRWSPRGSAQFIAVPISRCRLVEVWHESVPVNPYAPKLACCLAEPLPLNDDKPQRTMRVENTVGSGLECFSATMALLNLLRHRLAQGDRSPQTMEMCRQLGLVVYKNTNDNADAPSGPTTSPS